MSTADYSTIELLWVAREKVRKVTYKDYGKEMSTGKEISRVWGVSIFFLNPMIATQTNCPFLSETR